MLVACVFLQAAAEPEVAKDAETAQPQPAGSTEAQPAKEPEPAQAQPVKETGAAEAPSAQEAKPVEAPPAQEAPPVPAESPGSVSKPDHQPVSDVTVEETKKPDRPASKKGPRKEEANLRFNFHDVPLDTVLDYLSQTAGFIIVREAKVEGKIDVLSHQPLNKDEAVALLNTVLSNRGYAAIREDRTLTIVKREDAKFRDIPVKVGHEADTMPKSGEIITQIIPVRHADAAQLLENLTPLLPSNAVANANKSSNAIVLTDTETDVKRMATIIEALDSSISNISEIRVFPLTYSKAPDIAKLLTSLFQPPATQSPQQGQGPRPGGPGGILAAAAQFFGRGRRGGPDQQTPPPPESAAKQAAARVVAVADERTNSVVVAAPTDLMELIDSVIKDIDRISVPTTEIRVFNLKHSDPVEMADIINDALGQTGATSSTNNQQQRIIAGQGARAGGPRGAAPQSPEQTSTDSYAHATPDPRTKSVVVTAERVMMEQVARMIEQLEANPAKDYKVYVYKMKNADVQQVAAVLQSMINKQTTASQPRQQSTTSTSSTSSTRAGGTSSLGGRSSLLGR